MMAVQYIWVELCRTRQVKYDLNEEKKLKLGAFLGFSTLMYKQKKHVPKKAELWIRIAFEADRVPTFYLNADTDSIRGANQCGSMQIRILVRLCRQ
jgi:hypothetical protein